MSAIGLAGSSLFQFLNSSYSSSNTQNFQKEFQQLGQDLSSGNLSQAQADFQALQPSSASSGSTQTSASPLATAMKQLASDLQSGNLSAAQQDYSTVKQDMQQTSTAGHHHHHHHGSSQNSSQNPINQLFAQLGQSLQSGNLATAQSVYSSLQQDFQQLGGSTSTSAAAVSPVSLTA
jgi:outer membrane protein assembly factor BamD (BamD/ComL family)